MKRILLTVVFVFSLLIMFGGCENDGYRGRGQRWDQDRHSDRSDRDRPSEQSDRGSESRHDEERH